MTDDLRVICARIPGNELAAAECENLAGGRPDAEGVAVCRTLEHVWRSAYLSLGLRCLAEAPTLQALEAQVQSLDAQPGGFRPDRFCIEFLRLSDKLQISQQAAVRALADAIPARPDLHAPQRRFIIVVQAAKLWFAEILAEPHRSYRRHDAKPYRTSSSLPSRLARALVNLVSPPAQTLLDPFCGTGSILLEAQSVGLQAYGVDLNPKMTGMSRRNLAHFGYPAQVTRQDALEFGQPVDAIVTDLPYGRLLEPLDDDRLSALLLHLRELAPRALYLSEQDLSARLEQAGYRDVAVWRVRKRAGLSRYVHSAQAR